MRLLLFPTDRREQRPLYLGQAQVIDLHPEPPTPAAPAAPAPVLTRRAA
jgi:hypothetical protein